jgi:hypothetical protein
MRTHQPTLPAPRMPITHRLPFDIAAMTVLLIPCSIRIKLILIPER